MEPTKPDLLVAHFTHRKVDEIVTKVFNFFLDTVRDRDVTADQALAIGVSLLMNTAILPMERMAVDKKKYRKALASQVRKMILQQEQLAEGQEYDA